MTQYFVNCNDFTVTVCPALITSGGTMVWSTKWWTLAAGNTATWSYQSTVETGQYTTVYCEQA